MGSSPEGLTHTRAHTKDSSLEKISDDACILVGLFWALPQRDGKKCSQCVVPVRRPTSLSDSLDFTQLQEIL